MEYVKETIMDTKHNFHIPLPKDLYIKLNNEAKRCKRAATELARIAIAAWLREVEKINIRNDIAEYAEKYSGSAEDLDSDLENATIDFLTKE